MFGHPMELPLSSFTNNYPNIKNNSSDKKKVDRVEEEPGEKSESDDEKDEDFNPKSVLPSSFYISNPNPNRRLIPD
jgi:hypothetical protein